MTFVFLVKYKRTYGKYFDFYLHVMHQKHYSGTVFRDMTGSEIIRTTSGDIILDCVIAWLFLCTATSLGLHLWPTLCLLSQFSFDNFGQIPPFFLSRQQNYSPSVFCFYPCDQPQALAKLDFKWVGKKARIVRLIALYMAQKSTGQYVEYSIESVKCLLNSRGVFD